jgi:hypothetical protein
VWVSEIPFAGEIDAIAGEISGLLVSLTFNPDRGGESRILCDGPCRPDSVIESCWRTGATTSTHRAGVVLNR